MDAFADDAAPAETRRATTIAVVVSVALHVGVLAFLKLGISHEHRRTVTVIDIDTAPIAPKAEALPPEEPEVVEKPVPPPSDEAQEEQGVEEPAQPDQEGAGLADAGVEIDAAPEPVDAGVPVDARRRADAGVDAATELEQLAQVEDGGVAADADADADAGAVAVAAAAEDGDAGAVAAGGFQQTTGDGGLVTDDGDSGVVAATSSGGDSDGGVGTNDGGAGVPGADIVGTPGAKPSAGTGANLLTYFPNGHVITVMVRLDRLRDTEWAERVDTILSPLPDYKSLVGGTNVLLTDIFDVLVVSSPSPEDAVATTLVAKTRLTPPELRDFIDQPDAPVKWTAVKGGALGTRRPTARVFAGDQRVFLSWQPSWMVLTQPRDLGPLTSPRTGDIDRPARPVDLPPWLARAGTITDESGEPSGPAIMMTAAGMFGDSIPLMGAGGASIPAPEQATVTLEVVPKGFLVRGNLRYPDESKAATAQDAIMRLRVELLDQYGSVPILGGMPLLTVLRGLDIQRTGRRLAFASSASIADARGILELAAVVIKTHFEEQERLMQQRRQRRPAPSQRPAPTPTPTPAPPAPKSPP